MGQITLNFEDSKRILANPDSDPSAKLIAACAVVFFEAPAWAADADAASVQISQKLLRMASSAIDDEHQGDGDE